MKKKERSYWGHITVYKAIVLDLDGTTLTEFLYKEDGLYCFLKEKLN